MKKVVSLVLLGLFAAPVFAGSSCETIKAEIAAKIDAKGVKNYTIEIIPTEDVKDQKVIGWCDGGKKKLIYKKV